jgi:hypothetical protein
MKKSLRVRSMLLAVATVGLAASVQETAQAQSNCNSAASVVSSMWTRFGDRIKAKQCKDAEECLSNAQKKEELIREMIAFWNEQAQGSWATLGPRPLVVGGGYNDGKVVMGTSRLFVYQTGVAEGDTVEIKITKQGGGGGKVSLAHFDGKVCSQGTDVSFAKGDKDGTVKTLKLTGAKGKIPYVKVDADGTQSFDYKFTVTVK